MLDVNMGCNAQGGQRTVTRAAFGCDLVRNIDGMEMPSSTTSKARPTRRRSWRAAARHRRGRRGYPVNGFYCYPNSGQGYRYLSLGLKQAGATAENGVCSIYLSYVLHTVTSDISVYICGDGLAGSYHDATSGRPGVASNTQSSKVHSRSRPSHTALGADASHQRRRGCDAALSRHPARSR